MTAYVVGFALDRLGRVALIEKNRPAWQAGKLNGIGGKIEETDHYPLNAMRREFEEETGVYVHDWDHFVTMTFPGAEIFFYRARVDDEVLDSLWTNTDETVRVVHVRRVLDGARGPIIPNLSWLLPLAAYTADTYQPFGVRAGVAVPA